MRQIEPSLSRREYDLIRQLILWASRAGVCLLAAALLIACGATPVVESQSGTTGETRPGEASGLDQELLKQVDAQIAAAKASGQDVTAAQQLRDSAVRLAQQGSNAEANGNLKAAALQLGVLRDAGGQEAQQSPQPQPRAPAPAAAAADGPLLLRAAFSDAAAIDGWERIGPRIPTGTPVWEVENGMLTQRGVDGIDAVDEQTGLVTGDPQWADVTVRVDVLAHDTKEVGVLVRQQGESFYRFRALVVGTGTDSGNLILEKVIDGQITRLAEFAGPELSPDTWHTLAVAADGATITCFVDGRSVGTTEDRTLATGRAGVSTLAMSGAYFANLQVYGR
jgi:hypothetical protein